MDPVAAMIIGQVLNLGVQGVGLAQGIQDRRESDRIMEGLGDRPQYEIPESVDRMIQMYQQMSNQGLPGQGQMSRSIQGQTARSVTQAGQLADSPVGALTALNAAQQREAQAMRDLNVRAAQYRAQSRQNYAQAVGQRASYEQEQWRQNELLPWEIDMNRAMQLRSAGRGNIRGSLENMGAGLASGAANYAMYNMYSGMQPDYTTGQTQQQVAPPPMENPVDYTPYNNQEQQPNYYG